MTVGDIAAKPLSKTQVLKLYVGKASTGVTVQPDGLWPNMWRVHKDGQISDMVNLTRAKDAAVAWARPRGLGGNEVVHWHRRETI